MRALVAAMLLASLGACSSGGADTAVKPLPYAPPPPPMPEAGIACPTDVRQCPDGSYVGRIPNPACAFAPCPGAGQQ
jgi:hypothetical protein